jgi:hypothetical protein
MIYCKMYVRHTRIFENIIKNGTQLKLAGPFVDCFFTSMSCANFPMQCFPVLLYNKLMFVSFHQTEPKILDFKIMVKSLNFNISNHTL